MRHAVQSRRFDRPTDQRLALFRGLVTSLLKHEQIKTTEAKAKAVRPLAEKMITLGKSGTLANRRRALGYVYDKDVTNKLFGELAERYAARPGGYTRIVKLGPRFGDGLPSGSTRLHTCDEFNRPSRGTSGSTSSSATSCGRPTRKREFATSRRRSQFDRAPRSRTWVWGAQWRSAIASATRATAS